MDELIELIETPAVDEVYMVVGWNQWADAGAISSGLPTYLINHLKADKIGEIKPDGFYLFQIPGTHDLVRPPRRSEEERPRDHAAGQGPLLATAFAHDRRRAGAGAAAETGGHGLRPLKAAERCIAQGPHGPAADAGAHGVGCLDELFLLVRQHLAAGDAGRGRRQALNKEGQDRPQRAHRQAGQDADGKEADEVTIAHHELQAIPEAALRILLILGWRHKVLLDKEPDGQPPSKEQPARYPEGSLIAPGVGYQPPQQWSHRRTGPDGNRQQHHVHIGEPRHAQAQRAQQGRTQDLCPA